MLGLLAVGIATTGILLATISNGGPSAEILIGIGTIITALIGPFAAEQIAHKLAAHEARKRAIADLFVGIAIHIQEFDEALSLTNVKEERNRAADAIGAAQRKLYADCMMLEFLIGGAARIMATKLMALREMTLPWGSHDELFRVYPEKIKIVRMTLEESRDEMHALWRALDQDVRAA